MALNWSERLVDPRSPDRRPRKAAYALPTLFTAGNIFLGFLAIFKSFEGAMWAASGHMGPNAYWDAAAVMIGVAVALDGLDGRIARMTNTVSDFGREMDSLADCITFGLAPAVLAFVWGVYFVDQKMNPVYRTELHSAGYFFSFLFLLCGASRLARFNVTVNPMPTNPGRPDRKYFVGVPIPAAAGVVAAVIYFFGAIPIENWMLSLCWLAFLFLLSFLMVSTWRYRSFKDFNLLQPRKPLSFVFTAVLIYSIWNYSRPVLLALAILYVGSGIVVRVAGLIKRRGTERSAVAEG